MTTAIANTLNNIEEFLPQTKQDSTQNFGVDKNLNFKKVLDSKIEENPQLTLGDFKKTFTNNSEALNNFKKILKKATNEANVESSLDLTLAKDITEIISELKENLETTNEYTETEDEILENSEEVLLEASQEEAPLFYEQIISITNSYTNKETELSQSLIESNIEIEENNNFLEETVELIDSIENLADETVAKSTLSDELAEKIESVLDEEALKELNIESIEAEIDSSEGEAFLQQQAPEEYGIKAMVNQELEVFDLKLEQVSSIQSNNNSVQPKASEINPARILEQISKQMENLQNSSKVNLVLNPESLGKVNIQLLTTKEGLTAQFTVATQEARDLIMKGLDGLKDTLLSQGINIDNVSVKLNDIQKSEYSQDWTEQEGSRGGNKGQGQSNREEKQKGLFEQMMAQTNQKEENGNV